MRVLVIGGTHFVGAAITRELLRRDHEVTLFNRGRTSAPGMDAAARIVGDRDSDLEGLARGEWDATIDVCAYRPGQIDLLADALQGRGGRHVLISTVSVYAEDIPAHSDESATLADLAPLDGLDLDTCDIDWTTYGPLKVLCEQRAIARYGDPLLVRPTYVFGPEDHTMRYPRWVQRIADGGVVRAPEPRDGWIQWVDARDLAALTVTMLENGRTGPVHVVDHPVTFEQFLQLTSEAVGGKDIEFEWVTPHSIEAGVEEFPLWGGGGPDTVSAMSPARAVAEGLRCRPLAETARDTLAWVRAQSTTR